MRTIQQPLFTPETEWVMPEELKDLKGVKEIAVDLETNERTSITTTADSPLFETEHRTVNRTKIPSDMGGGKTVT